METVTTYIAGTDRVDTSGPSPTLPDPNAPSSSNRYDLAGNVISFHKSSSVGTSPTDPSQGTRNIEQTRNYYDADHHLVASDRKICVLVITAWTDPSPTATCKGPDELDDSNANVFEWYRYDALGRRVLMRTRRDHNCTTNACASSITRNVWDGNELLYEIRSSGGKVGPATLENDHASGDNYGSVAYTHGLGIDQPLDLVRIGYPDDFGVEYDMQHWGGPFAIVPLADWRGGYRAGTMANGHRTPCGPGEGCEMLTWPAENYTPFWDAREPVSRKNWFGSLVLASKDGSGLMYRRNRYYNPTTGQFTQEDPIGLAGGLNLYGFANGDPVTFSDPFGLKAEGPCLMDPMCTINEAVSGLVAGLAAGAAATSEFVRSATIELATNLALLPVGGVLDKAAVEVGGAAVRMTRWGWSGGAKYRAALDAVAGAADNATLGAGELGGILPSRVEAERMIAESGGRIRRIERAHIGGEGHKVPHINYITPNGREATIEVESVGRQFRR